MFALHRRTAWGAAAIEASAWDFDSLNLEYCGSVVLPRLSSNLSRQSPTLFQFIDEGQALIYASAYSFYKVPLSTPYDILTADLTAIPSSGTNAYASANIYQSALSAAQFLPDGRSVIGYYSTSGSSNFRLLPLDIAFDPFGKQVADLVVQSPSRVVTGPYHVQFSSNGLSFFTFPNNSSQYELYKFSLTEPFNVSTLSLSVQSISISSLPRNDYGTGENYSGGFGSFAIAPDGLRLITCGDNVLRLWKLQQPWDISRISFVKYRGFSTNIASNISRVDVDPTSTFLYVYSDTTNAHRVVQFAINRS